MIDQTAIDAVNQRLELASIPVKVRRNGKYLVLRANLPKKPGEGQGKKQRDLSLGIPATKSGLNRAEKAAKRLEVQLNENTFTWAEYDRSRQPEPEAEATADLITRFKSAKMQAKRKKSCSEETWNASWMAVYKKLPQNEPLSENNIFAVLKTSDDDSRNRQQHVQKLQALCDFAGLSLNLKDYLGEYEPVRREIPSDQLIEEWHDRIPNTAWRWAYGVIATFGIRPHEVFFCDLTDEITLQVHEGKTGPRVSHAIRPEWVKRWGLMEKCCPKINRKTFKEYGQSVSLQMSRYGLPFVPYDLRHAWAIRASVEIGLPHSTAADLMGHSVDVHTAIYHRWLTENTNRKVYKRLVLGIKD